MASDTVILVYHVRLQMVRDTIFEREHILNCVSISENKADVNLRVVKCEDLP